MLLGAYTKQGLGVTRQTIERKDLIEKVVALSRLRPEGRSESPFCSTQINHSPVVKTHSDRFNERSSWVISSINVRGLLWGTALASLASRPGEREVSFA
eukprot:3205794-Amphidinium_carterae.2